MSTKKRMLAAAVGGVVLSGASSANAQDAVQWRVEDGGNGHWYRRVPVTGGVGWAGAIAAAEAAVGLAIVLSIYRSRDTVDMEQFNLLRW